MKNAAAIVCILIAALLAVSASYGHPQTAEQTEFRVEIQPKTEHGQMYTVTNFTGKVVTACFIEQSFWSNPQKSTGRMAWDSVLQGVPPIEPGAAISENLIYAVGGPLPDKVEVIAGIFADGSTFGPDERVKLMLSNRAIRETEYDQAVSFLQQGLERNWTRDQFLESLNAQKSISGPMLIIRSSFQANERLNDNPRHLQTLVDLLLKMEIQKRDALREAKPRPAPAN